MPPYAGDSFAFASSSDNAAYADATPTKPEEQTDDSSATEHSQGSSRFDALFDFNPCTSMGGMSHSMNSAMFKVRPCAWCGKGCNKLNGYKKEEKESVQINEETGEEEPVNQKIYYHKKCAQLKEWRDVHSEGWSKVMDGLLGHFRAIEEAERRRKEAEERARREAEERARREAEQARLAREAAARKKAEEEEQRRIEEEAREAEEERIRSQQEEARRKKEASLRYKVGKKFSKAKKAITAPCKSKKAVDEDATGDAEEEQPEM